MRNIKTILRLHYEAGLSHRKIAQSLNVGYGTVVDYVKRAKQAALEWPIPGDMDEAALCALLFAAKSATEVGAFVRPDCPTIHQELKRKGVTKQLLWQEYREQHPNDGYSYTQFCHHYRAWVGTQKRSMRQIHRVGEKMFVDYSGPTLPVVNADTGATREAEVFVAVLGASSYTFACASWSQQMADWLDAHVQAFAFFGGVPEIVVPDNLKSAVTKTHRYEPGINASYQQLAEHYGVAIIPARPYKPKDKAKAEVGVQLVERWIMARLRHQTFFTLAALNEVIRTLLQELNQRLFKKRPGSRLSQFEQLDKPALRPLPTHPYQYAEIKQMRVQIDYHIAFDKHYYSVPHHLVKRLVEVQANHHVVVIYHCGQRVASHPYSDRQGEYSTCREHMPDAHRAMSEWSHEHFLQWAKEIGNHTYRVVGHLLQQPCHRELRYRRAQAMISCANHYGRDRLEKACVRALRINSPTRSSVVSILKTGLDKAETTPEVAQEKPCSEPHSNVRGEDYYR